VVQKYQDFSVDGMLKRQKGCVLPNMVQLLTSALPRVLVSSGTRITHFDIGLLTQALGIIGCPGNRTGKLISAPLSNRQVGQLSMEI